MKKIYSFIIICLIAVLVEDSSAQTILSMTVVPANPTTADTIKIYIENQFTSGNCSGVAYPPTQSGDTFTASALHCLGMLTVICNDYDTVIINPQPAGQYTFVFMLYFGYGFPSCSSALLPSDTAEVSFTVSDPAGVNEILNPYNISVYPNPLTSSSILQLRTQIKDALLSGGQAQIVIYNMLGKEMLRKSFSGNRMEIEKENLKSGVYFVKVSTEERQWVQKIVVE